MRITRDQLNKYLMLLIGLFLTISSHEQSLKKILMHRDSSLTDVRITPLKTDPEVFIAILVSEPHWWETISIVQFHNHRIGWHAKFDVLPSAQSIYSARQISLKGFSDPMIEVFDKTHMGNGFYYLYRLRGHKAELLLETRALDRNMDGAEKVGDSLGCSLVFKNDTLTPSYNDVDQAGFADVTLTGEVLIYAQDDKKLLRKWKVKEVFLYNKSRQRFIEDRRLRIGKQPLIEEDKAAN